MEAVAAAALGNDEALHAIQQLQEEVQEKLAEEKEKEEADWYRMATKEEYEQTEETAEAKDQSTDFPETMEDRAEDNADEKRAKILEEKTEEKAEDKYAAPTEEKNEVCAGQKNEEKEEEKKEEKEEPDWNGSQTEESEEEGHQKKTPEEALQKKTPADGDEDSEDLQAMSQKELRNSLRVSYQAAIMNLQDAKKEVLLGLSSKGSSACMEDLYKLKKKAKSLQDPVLQEGPHKRRKRRRHHRREEEPWLCFTCITVSPWVKKMQAAYFPGCGLGISCIRDNIHESLQKGKYIFESLQIGIYIFESLQKGKYIWKK